MRIINIEVLKENVGDDADFIRVMIDTFLEHFPKYLEDFKTALTQNNTELAGQVAHKMKSSLRLFGAMEVGVIAEKIEEEAKQNKVTQTDADNFISLVAKIIDEVKAYTPN